MGYMRHVGIIVTGFGEHTLIAHKKALSIFPEVSPIMSSQVNSYGTFCIPPDGSKLGWPESELGDTRRDAFITFLKKPDLFVDWVEVQYGDDDGCTKSLRPKNRRN